MSGNLDGEFVDLGGRMAGSVVDAHHGLLGRAARQAEHLPRLWIEPGALEVDALVLLDRQVALVRLPGAVGAVTPTNPLCTSMNIVMGTSSVCRTSTGPIATR
jgi:hypothetical protein